MLFWLLIGGTLGAVVGHFRKPGPLRGTFLSGWKRGAISGSVIAIVLYTASGDGFGLTMNRSTANVQHIGDTEFDTVVAKSSQPVVVDCYATWCGPCRQLAPIVDDLAKEYAGKIKFVKVNVDESPGVSQKFQIEAIPALLFFKNGQLTGTSVGLVTKADLARQLDVLLQTNAPATAVHSGFTPLLSLPGGF